jgi:uncharacterized protein YkwD
MLTLALLVALVQDATHSEKKTIGGAGHALQCVTNSTEAQKCQDVFQQLNQYRTSLGLAALAYDFRLEECIEGHCHHMAQHRFFSHYAEEPEAADPWKRASACGTTANGENIAAGYPTAVEVMNAWKSSSGHDANMRNSFFTRVGCGYYYDGASPYRHYWGQLFGTGPVTQAQHSKAVASNPILYIDKPAEGTNVSGTVLIEGWAADLGSASGTGVDQVHLYLDGNFLGAATYGTDRPDVANVFGARFQYSGYRYSWDTSNLAAGSHTIEARSRSTLTGAWKIVTRGVVRLDSRHYLYVDVPAEGNNVSGVVVIEGWSADLGRPGGTGVDLVHVYLDGSKEEGGTFLGAATLGVSRPDVFNVFGVHDTGYRLSWDTASLSNGAHTLFVYARSTVTGAWKLATRNVVKSESNPIMFIDVPAEGETVSGVVTVGGWAADLASGSGPGVDAVHVYVSGSFTGAANYGRNRPDVANVFGPNFQNSGYSLAVDLPSGTHTITVYARSALTGGWISRTRTVTVTR